MAIFVRLSCVIVESRDWKDSRQREASCTMPVSISGSSKDSSDAKTEAHWTKEARKAAFEVFRAVEESEARVLNMQLSQGEGLWGDIVSSAQDRVQDQLL